jgi:hypothetical protein
MEVERHRSSHDRIDSVGTEAVDDDFIMAVAVN